MYESRTITIDGSGLSESDSIISNNLYSAKVSIIAPIYEYFPLLAPALISQTYQNWELFCIHDGSSKTVRSWIDAFNDDRIKYIETETRFNDWGHSLRAFGLTLIDNDSDFILHTNMDNYYVSIFLEKMVSTFEAYLPKKIVALFCNMLHNELEFCTKNSSLEFGRIDCGSILWRTSVALELGWEERHRASDWNVILAGVMKYGRHRFAHLDATYFIHN